MGCCPSFHGIDVLPHTGASDRNESDNDKTSESEKTNEIELSDPAPDFDRMLEEAEKKRPKSPKFSLRRQNRMVFE